MLNEARIGLEAGNPAKTVVAGSRMICRPCGTVSTLPISAVESSPGMLCGWLLLGAATGDGSGAFSLLRKRSSPLASTTSTPGIICTKLRGNNFRASVCMQHAHILHAIH